MGTKKVGKVRQRLAKLLQSSFPSSPDGRALTWDADWLYPATGAYRTNSAMDCYRWEGAARHYRQDGSYIAMMSVGSYETMSTLVKAKRLTLSSSGEVVPEDDSSEADSVEKRLNSAAIPANPRRAAPSQAATDHRGPENDAI